MKALPDPAADTPSFDEIRAAVANLTAESERQFGTMSPAAMLRHNSRFLELYLGEVAVPAPIRILARALGRVLLARVIQKSARRTPKGLRTIPALKVKAEDHLDLEAERVRFLGLLGRIEALEGEQQHVMYGPTPAQSVKDLVRHHTAHHLHQFSLLSS